jgi:hypothetical protein
VKCKSRRVAIHNRARCSVWRPCKGACWPYGTTEAAERTYSPNQRQQAP